MGVWTKLAVSIETWVHTKQLAPSCEPSAAQLTMGDKEDPTYIGFSCIADQYQRKTVKRGFEFTLMVVGESGLGKSTMINSLFLTDLYRNRTLPPVNERLVKTTEIEKTTLDIEEAGVKLRLTIVDTPGYGDGLEGADSWQACVKYVDDQFAQYFEGESGVNRRNLVDSRVHCCLYFISPYGHGLKPLDFEFLKRLQFKVNLIPVLAKADCLTQCEVNQRKARILKELSDNEIEIYQFPDCDSDEDDDFKDQNEKLKLSIPFALVGASQILEINGKKTRGRQYPWGVVDIENPEHSDFTFLKRFLIQTHMQDLKDVTHDVHYENYRITCINELRAKGISVGGETEGPGTGERRLLKRDSIAVNESEYEDPETMMLLHQKDQEIKKMQAMLEQMQQKLNSGN